METNGHAERENNFISFHKHRSHEKLICILKYILYGYNLTNQYTTSSGTIEKARYHANDCE